MSNVKYLAIVVGIVFITVVVAGIKLGGSPNDARAEKSDRNVEESLRGMNRLIVQFHVENKRLPASIDEMQEYYEGSAMVLDDFRAVDSSEYIVTGETAYKLCAIYLTSQFHEEVIPVRKEVGYTDFSNHEAGEYCHNLNIISQI